MPPTMLPSLPLARLRALPRPELMRLGRAAGAFLDVAGTATGRATFYNTQREQAAAEANTHEALFDLSPEVYVALASLPGTTDHTRILTIGTVLGRTARVPIEHLVEALPPQRMFRLFDQLRHQRVNNARTRRVILRSILDSHRLELWSVKYRRKMARALRHALGRRRASVLASILNKTDRTGHERGMLARELERHSRLRAGLVHECVAFVFGKETGLTLDLLRRYRAAKSDLDAAEGLPPEVIGGLRSTYHKDVDPAAALRLSRHSMTSGQRLRVQARAARANVRVDFDPRRHSPVELYIYAYERGLSEAIERALDEQAKALAAKLPFAYARIGILLDSSASMAGHATQALRPMASALATRDVLMAAADEAVVYASSGQSDRRLVRPEGDTSLAAGLVELLRRGCDAVFVLTDGYENAPAGRFAETMARIRELDIATPVYQASPVFGAEAGGLRRLAADHVPALPVARPEAFGLALLRGLFDVDPLPALEAVQRLLLHGKEKIR